MAMPERVKDLQNKTEYKKALNEGLTSLKATP